MPGQDVALVRPRSVTKHHALGLKKVVVPFEDTLRVIVQRSDEEKAGATSVENSKPREKSTFNPPSKELVGAGTKKASRKKQHPIGGRGRGESSRLGQKSLRRRFGRAA